MEIEIINEKKREIELIIHGEDHTLCNVLRKYLMEDDDVDYAVYGIKHPIVGEPHMIIRTKANANKPTTILKRASKNLKEDTQDFKKLVEANF